jgi:uncharacterized protein (UPF0335 family)
MADGNVAADQLRLFVERVERLYEEVKGINEDIRDVYAEAKANGYDVPTMRKVVKLRAMETISGRRPTRCSKRTGRRSALASADLSRVCVRAPAPRAREAA